MNTERWKSVAVEKDSYYILQALCKHGFRKPGAMISKMVDEVVVKLAKKENMSHDKMKDKLLLEGKALKK